MKNFDSTKLKQSLKSIFTSVFAVLLAVIVGGVLVSFVGVNPVEVFASLFKGAFGSRLSFIGTLNRMAPILLAGLAITVGNSAGMFNIGFTGQFLMGSLLATMVGAYVKLPAIPLCILVLLAGVVGACLWAAVPTYCLLKRNVNFVFSGIMMNYIALYFCSWAIMKFPGYSAMNNATPTIQDAAKLPNIFQSLGGVNLSIVIAIVFVILSHIIMFKTKAGFEMRSVGYNRDAAWSAGISINKRMFQAGMLSAVFAGLSGALEIMGNTFRLTQLYEPAYVATGIAVAMLGKTNPIAICIAAMLFAGMKQGTTMMQMKTGVSAQFVLAVQAILIVFICSESFITYITGKIRQNKKIKAEG